MTETTVNRFLDVEVGWEDSSEVIGLLKAMRHTTQFEPRVIPKEFIQQILAAARWSSSLYNNQPWYFVVVADRAAHRALQERVWEARKKLSRWRPLLALFLKPLRDAQLQASLKKAQSPEEVIFDHTVVMLCAIDIAKPEAMASASVALNNMALEATRLGMGSAFVSATRSLNHLKPAAQEFGLPEGYRFFVSLMVGFPKRDARLVKGMRKEVTEISHWM